MRLQPDTEHPHGMSDAEFDALLGPADVFAYRLPVADPPARVPANESRKHACPRLQGRGTTTTPFDMVMLNDLDRFHLVIDVIDRVPGLAARAGASGS